MTAGAAATFSSGAVWSLGLVVSTGPTQGSADVYVDGTLAGVINTHTAVAATRKISFAISTVTAGTHTIRIVNLATKGHPDVTVEGMIGI
jgi:hypothetical protein